MPLPPRPAASFSIFQPSSYHLVVNTAFGLRLQVQLLPVMQLFLTLDQDAQGQVQGLCGNFNGQEGDDFKTAGGLVEATGAGFANTWKAQSSCHDKLDWLDDPCSLNIETGEAPPRPGGLALAAADGVAGRTWGVGRCLSAQGGHPPAAFCHAAGSRRPAMAACRAARRRAWARWPLGVGLHPGAGRVPRQYALPPRDTSPRPRPGG